MNICHPYLFGHLSHGYIFGKNLLITLDLSLLLQKCIQPLKSVNLGYPSFNFYFYKFEKKKLKTKIYAGIPV